MSKKTIRDFKCASKDGSNILVAMSNKSINILDAYRESYSISETAIEYRKLEKNSFSVIPLSHTVEAESMGADINYDMVEYGIRAGSYKCETLNDLLNLDDMDLKKSPVSEIISAIRYMKSKGEKVILEISGPFTIFDFFIEPKKVYKSLRKKEDIMYKVFEKSKKNILYYADEAMKAGADVISYSDSSGGVSILGPRLVENVYNMFTKDFLIELENLARKNKKLIHLCPKTTQIVIGMEEKKLKEIDLISTQIPTYEEAMDEICERIEKEDLPLIMGQMCINMNKAKMYSRKIKMIEMSEANNGFE